MASRSTSTGYPTRSFGHTVTIHIYNVSTGQRLNTGMMDAGKTSGKFDVQVPSAGVYIAKTTFPLASGGREVTIAK